MDVTLHGEDIWWFSMNWKYITQSRSCWENFSSKFHCQKRVSCLDYMSWTPTHADPDKANKLILIYFLVLASKLCTISTPRAMCTFKNYNNNDNYYYYFYYHQVSQVGWSPTTWMLLFAPQAKEIWKGLCFKINVINNKHQVANNNMQVGGVCYLQRTKGEERDPWEQGWNTLGQLPTSTYQCVLIFSYK